jgi:hypothetical protein
MTTAREIETIEEYTIGTEDRVLLGQRKDTTSEPQWYYQIRGTPNIHGPFATAEDATTEYNALTKE